MIKNSKNKNYNFEYKNDNSFEIKNDRSFKSVKFFGRPYKEAFWKVHISPSYSDYQEVLNIVSKIVVPMKINFKFVKDRSTALSFVNVRTLMAHSGKLITIYPNSVDEASTLMKKLYIELKKYSGSEILTDRQYKDSKIIFLDMV